MVVTLWIINPSSVASQFLWYCFPLYTTRRYYVVYISVERPWGFITKEASGRVQKPL